MRSIFRIGRPLPLVTVGRLVASRRGSRLAAGSVDPMQVGDVGAALVHAAAGSSGLSRFDERSWV